MAPRRTSIHSGLGRHTGWDRKRRQSMNRWRKVLLRATPLIAFAGPALGQSAPKTATKSSSAVGPRFEVDMLWPKPMPNRWILGGAVGVAVDSRDHVFVLNVPDYFTARTEIGSGTEPPSGEGCSPPPPVAEGHGAA